MFPLSVSLDAGMKPADMGQTDIPVCPPREGFFMKPSARNQLKGRITNILRGATTSHITIDVNSTLITSVMIGVD